MKNSVHRRIDISKNDLEFLRKIEGGTTLARRNHIIFCDALLLEDFKLFVQKTRKRLNIPENGFDGSFLLTNGTIYNVTISAMKERRGGKTFHKKLSDDVLLYVNNKHYFKKYTDKDLFSFDVLTKLIEEYITYNSISGGVGYVGDISYENNGGDEAYADRIKILVRPDIRKEELLEFINNNFFLIKDYGRIANLKRKIPKNDRLKVYKEFDKDISIYNRYLELMAEGRTIKGKGYVENIIAREIAEEIERCFKQKISDDTVKTTIQRMRKKIKQINL